MRGRAASELLSLPVRMHGIQLGTPVDALLDARADRLLGFEVLCGDGAHGCEGHIAWPLNDREPALLETVRPGVFAAGDVRAGAANRVAGAVGDGAMVVRFAHDVLAG